MSVVVVRFMVTVLKIVMHIPVGREAALCVHLTTSWLTFLWMLAETLVMMALIIVVVVDIPSVGIRQGTEVGNCSPNSARCGDVVHDSTSLIRAGAVVRRLCRVLIDSGKNVRQVVTNTTDRAAPYRYGLTSM